MRGVDGPQGALFSYVSLEFRISLKHAFRSISKLVETAHLDLDGALIVMYSYTGWPSIQPEHLMRASLRPIKHWAEVIADPVIADAIRDRLEHAALTIDITGESYRGVKARQLASQTKDS